jgi:putative endonuclease
MFYVYIIYSQQLDKFYTGYTENLVQRLEQHNSGFSKYTAKTNDWALMYSKEFETRLLAHRFELAIKKKKSRKYIEWLITQ